MTEVTGDKVSLANDLVVYPYSNFDGLFSSVANHEAKLAVLGLLGINPDRYFTASGLSKELSVRQTGEDGWAPNKSTVWDYCTESLEPIGAAVKSDYPAGNRIVSAYSVSEVGSSYGMALVGTIGKWSLDHMDLSVQNIFGPTNTTGDVRAPNTRLSIIRTLLASPEQALSLSQMREHIPDLLPQTVDKMPEIIDKITTQSLNRDPSFRLLGSDYNGQIPFELLSPETKALYQTVGVLILEGTEVVTLTQLVETVNNNFPGLDTVFLRKNLFYSVSQKMRHRYSLLQLDETTDADFSDGAHSVVRLKKEHADPLKRLVEAVDLARDEDSLGINIDQAKGIVNDKRQFASLMAKARTNSPRARVKDRGTTIADEVRAILTDEDGRFYSAQDVLERLVAKQIQSSLHTVRISLNELAVKGEVGEGTKSQAIGRKKPIKTYGFINDAHKS